MKRLNFILALGAICLGGFLASCERSKPEIPDNPETTGGRAIITIEEVDAETGVVTRSYDASERHVTWSGEGGDIEISGERQKAFGHNGEAFFDLALSARENVIYQGWSIRNDGDRIEDAYAKDEGVVAQTRVGLQDLGVLASFRVVKQNESGDTHVKFRVEYVKADEDLSKIEIPHVDLPLVFTQTFLRKIGANPNPYTYDTFRGQAKYFFNYPFDIRARLRTVRFSKPSGPNYAIPYPESVLSQNYYPFYGYERIFKYMAYREIIQKQESRLLEIFWLQYARFRKSEVKKARLTRKLKRDLKDLYYDLYNSDGIFVVPWGDFEPNVSKSWEDVLTYFYDQSIGVHPLQSREELTGDMFEKLTSMKTYCRDFYDSEVVPLRKTLEDLFRGDPRYPLNGAIYPYSSLNDDYSSRFSNDEDYPFSKGPRHEVFYYEPGTEPK